MQKTSWVVCQSLLLKCSSEKRKALFKLLPSSKQKELQELTAPERDPLQFQDSLEEQLYLIHPSWIAPFLRSLAESDIRLFLSSLKKTHAEELQKNLLFTNNLLSLSSSAKNFLQKTLWDKLGAFQQYPLACLPKSPLNILLTLSSSLFNTLIFLLGLHDLAHEMRQIIETAKLKKIQSTLYQEELKFLKILMQKKEPVAFKKLSLSQWTGDKISLRNILQGRGINRLAKALYGQHESFIWHLTHRLEIETAKQFIKLSTPLDLPRAKDALIVQIEEAFSYLQTHTSR
ncbi:MAG: hypothetical protein V4494_06685 [Chlamydiota bacterium]